MNIEMNKAVVQRSIELWSAQDTLSWALQLGLVVKRQ